jgi:hypothetical protein
MAPCTSANASRPGGNCGFLAEALKPDSRETDQKNKHVQKKQADFQGNAQGFQDSLKNLFQSVKHRIPQRRIPSII